MIKKGAETAVIMALGGAIVKVGGKIAKVGFAQVKKGLKSPKVQKVIADVAKKEKRFVDEFGQITRNQVGAIRTFQKNGKTYSLDNRRLKAFQDAGVPIKTRPATTTTTNDGKSIRIRIC